jgi:hypothetical protein
MYLWQGDISYLQLLLHTLFNMHIKFQGIWMLNGQKEVIT